MSKPSLDEIEATIKRMEAHHAGSAHMPAYRALCLRFAMDLGDARDLALARSAALMLIRYLDGETQTLPRPSPEGEGGEIGRGPAIR